MKISLRTNIKQLTKNLDALAKKQVPFATAQALNALAKHVALVEKKNIKTVFPTARPFTVNSVSTKLARKDNLTATIDLRPIAASYLRPFEFGGPHTPIQGNNDILDPIQQKVNTYGNIPRGTYAKLKARKDVFEGRPKGRPNAPYGLWQRPFIREQQKDVSPTVKIRRKMRNRHAQKIPAGANTTGKLRLLILIANPLDTKQRLNWHALAQGCVKARWKREFDVAMKQALATAKQGNAPRVLG